ncbi:hypothetical protein LEP1GSC036_0413 [Leptospira weilii str. 2006001853]|uniref:Uncharacterized protein n=1 Tax=Leptospira weilii str. 2006001853 TaxID=1001589 RepID=A0A828Z3Y7_9LEPT|nr:hypothetical protein LEP1GSC036_0413 [Leptospira weilii str. 2006001853]EMN44814.1 hypothetical protein LEP1GSC086_0732 [Leptospira weilii str. LNT 1234]
MSQNHSILSESPRIAAIVLSFRTDFKSNSNRNILKNSNQRKFSIY